ncbi:MAG TPA: DUF2341 domain-containing protein, partial [Planctomycetota bacterium]|nr:DUF2341 domain-containing protein [Planctomycetota bacterium]
MTARLRFRPLQILILLFVLGLGASLVYATTTAQWTQTGFYPSDGTYNGAQPINNNGSVGISSTIAATYPTSGSLSDLVTAQLDGDSDTEYVAANIAGAVYAFDANHSLLWSRTGLGYIISLVAADVNNDGTDDIIVGTQGTSTLYVLNNSTGANLATFNSGSAIGNLNIWSESVVTDTSTFWATTKRFHVVRSAQLDGDANREIIGVTSFGTVHAFQDTGAISWTYTVTTNSFALVRILGLAAGDINADGIDDAIFTTSSQNGLYNNRLYAVDGVTGGIISGFPIDTANQNYTDAKVDNICLIDSDGAGGKDRIAVGCSDGVIRYYDFTGSLAATSPNLGSAIYCVTPRNTDGSSREETLAGTKAGLLYDITSAGTGANWNSTINGFVFRVNNQNIASQFLVSSRYTQNLFRDNGQVSAITTTQVGYAGAFIPRSGGLLDFVYISWDNNVYRSSGSGSYISPLISPEGGVLRWRTLTYDSTGLTVDVLRGSDNAVLATSVASGTDLSTLANIGDYTGSLRLRANLTGVGILNDWSIGYETPSAGTYTYQNPANNPVGARYRRPLTITETSGTTLTNFPVFIDLQGYNPGLPNYLDFARMQSNGADIRFTTTGGQPLNYWIEWFAPTPTNFSRVWVNMPNLPASSATQIYMYYGITNPANVSDGNGVFTFFDDFTGTVIDTSKWSETDTATNYITQNGTQLYASGGTSSWNTGLYSVPNFNRSDGLALEFYYYRTNSADDAFGWRNTNSAWQGTNYNDLTYARRTNGTFDYISEDGTYMG